MLHRNSVFLISYQWERAPFTGLCRFLATDGKDAAALIAFPEDDLRDDRLRGPVIVNLMEFLSQIEQGHITAVQYTPSRLTMSDLSEASLRSVQHRKSIIADLKLDDDILFNPALLSKLLKTAEKTHGLSDRSIRRLVYGYYAGGQTELALVPGFAKRGGPGRRQNIGTARRGRKSNNPHHRGAVPLPAIFEKLRDGAETHYLPGKKTFYAAFVATLRDHFRKEGADPSAPDLSDILVPVDQQPTKWQFLYVVRMVEKEKGKRLAIPGRMRPLPETRESRGQAIDDVKGPGHRFEIDASKLQVQLVSRYGKTRIVGTPSIYVVVDVWSSAIVGYCISLENFSWALAASALANAFSSKQQTFQRLELPYIDSDWPCQHLPTALTADRAELITDKSGGIPNIGIKVEIAKAMCPEMKGTVESKFNEVKHQRSYKIPGAFPKKRQRREKDGKGDAVLNIDQLERMLVDIIIDINNQPIAASRIPPELIEDGSIDISRIGLYAWGIINKPGFTRTMSEDEYKLYLLTAGIGSITPKGIRFDKQNFRPQSSINQLVQKHNKKIEIRYNEHDASIIYFYSEHTRLWEPGYNDNPNINRRQVTFFEYTSFCQLIDSYTEDIRKQQAHEISLKQKQNSKIVSHAKKQAKQERALEKPRKSRQAIRQNRAVELAIGPQKKLKQTADAALPESPRPKGADIATSVKSIAEISAEIFWEEE